MSQLPPSAPRPSPVGHATFTIERTLRVSAARVFDAWACPEAKARWFAGSEGEWTQDVREMDFRVGGRERLIGTWNTGKVSRFEAKYHVIDKNRLIVYTYDMYVNDDHISVSIATVALASDVEGSTKMSFTEQVTVLDDRFPADGREAGTRVLLDRLAASLSDPKALA